MKHISLGFLVTAVVVNAVFPAGFALAAFDYSGFGDTSFGNSYSGSFGTPTFGTGSNGSYGDTNFGGSNTGSFGTVGFSGSTNNGSFGNTSFGGGSVGSFGDVSFGTGTGSSGSFGTATFGNGSTGTSGSFGTATFGTGTGTGSTGSFGTATFGSGGTTATFGTPTFGTGTGTGSTGSGVAFGIPSFGPPTTGGVGFGIPTFGPPTFTPPTYTPPTYTPPTYEPPTFTPPTYTPPTTNPNPTGFAPYAQTGAATNLGTTYATLNGSVSANGSATSYWFEYGTTISLGQNSQVFSAGTATYTQSVSAAVSNLTPNTTYYFRVVAQNAYGTAQGAILSFGTTGTVQNYTPSLVITPNFATVTQNQSAIFYAQYDADGAQGPQAATDVSFSANWSSNNTAIATRTGSNGQFTGVNAGTAQIIATYAGLTAYATLSVTGGVTGSAPSAQTNSATGVSDTSATVNGWVNANGAATTYWFEYGTNYSMVSRTGNQSAGSGNSQISAMSFLSGLSQNTTYYFRVVAQNQFGTAYGATLSFTTTGVTNQGSAPSVQTTQASGVGNNSATLSGTVNPNSSNTNYWFEYGTTTNLGQTSTQQSLGNGTFAQSVFANVNNLNANTTYYFRAVAQNAYGTSYGSVLSFTTTGGGNNNGSAPSVQTNTATGVNQQSATLNGSVNANGATTNYWFEYGTTTNLGQTTSFQNAGSNSGSFSISASIYGLAANTTYYFRAVAQNQYGTSYGQILNFQTNGGGFFGGNAPYAQTNTPTGVGNTYATFNGLVSPNGSDTYTWFEYGVNPSSLVYTSNSNYVGSGSGSTNVSQNVNNLASNTTYYYRVVARNNNGTSYGSIVSFNTNGYGNTNGNAPTVVTRPANYVYRTSALLTGDVYGNSGVTSGWFEYGLTTSLGLTTGQQPVGNGTNAQGLVYALSGLVPNTTYYFRAAAQNQYGTAYGQILSFRTTGTTVVTYPPVYQPPVYVPVTPTVTGVNQECVIVTPASNVTQVDAGQEFILTVTYRNTCSYPITNATLRIVLPAEVQFISADNPYFVREGNTLTFNLGTIPAGGQGTITIRAKVSDDVDSGAVLIINHTLGFNDNRGNYRTVNSLLSLTVDEGNSLLASLFDFLRRLFGYCWFWILLALLILLLVLFLMYRALSGNRTTTEVRRVDIMNHQ